MHHVRPAQYVMFWPCLVQIIIHCSHDEMPELRLSTFSAKDIFEKLKEV